MTVRDGGRIVSAAAEKKRAKKSLQIRAKHRQRTGQQKGGDEKIGKIILLR